MEIIIRDRKQSITVDTKTDQFTLKMSDSDKLLVMRDMLITAHRAGRRGEELTIQMITTEADGKINTGSGREWHR